MTRIIPTGPQYVTLRDGKQYLIVEEETSGYHRSIICEGWQERRPNKPWSSRLEFPDAVRLQGGRVVLRVPSNEAREYRKKVLPRTLYGGIIVDEEIRLSRADHYK